jgi:hypothetical protein
MEAQRNTNFNEFYKSIGEHSVNIRAEECFDKVLYHVNSQILKCKIENVITMGPTHELAQQCLNLLAFIRLMGVITLMRTHANVIDVWFCVSNILEKNKKFQMELFLHNVIFNVLVYIF